MDSIIGNAAVSKTVSAHSIKVRILFCALNERVANVGVGYGLQNHINASSILVPFSFGAEANLVEALDWKSKGIGSKPICTTSGS